MNARFAAGRFDDLKTGRGLLFPEIASDLSAWRLSEVADVVAAAEQATEAGWWVSGFIAYEAAAAFDPGLPVHRPIADIPWHGSASAPNPSRHPLSLHP